MVPLVFLYYRLLSFIAISSVLLFAGQSAAATLPSGFTETVLASGLTSPTAMAFAPDGRLFIAQQGGQLRIIKNGTLLATPFLSLSVNSVGERGLLGVAFDPDFTTNHFVYVYYTATSPTVHNRVSRFTANGDIAVANSEHILLDLATLGATNHNGGALHFAADDTLYIAVGDNANSATSQTLTSLFGKILRINPDGTIPTNNPFFNTATGVNRSIWALGLRNPFTFAIDPDTGKIFINDVGQTSWEEINTGIAGANYGWPETEGPHSNPAYRNPFYAYQNDSFTCAITGGTFYRPSVSQFPTTYIGKYFFSDYCGGWIKYVDPNNSATVTNFAEDISLPVDLQVGLDGALYYLARGEGKIYRVVSTQGGGQGPTITSQPVSQQVGVGQSVTFSVTASGTAPLRYQWTRNSVNITGATAASYTRTGVTLSDNGALFRCVVSNTSDSVTSNAATLTVDAGANQPPVGTIVAPAQGALYSGGLTIVYRGSGSDPETGVLPASAFTWRVDFHHDTHVHPFLAERSGSTFGTFVIPRTGETAANVWYRIHLTVTDAGGLTHSTFRDVLPRTVSLMLASNVPGMPLQLDGQPRPASFSEVAVVGMTRTLGAPPQQTVGGTSYRFLRWSDGRPATHTVTVPAINSTYTAFYTSGTSGQGPTITSQPVSQQVGVGQSVTFSVTASGTAPLRYQWTRNGVNIVGAVAASYTRTGVTAGDNGALFRCVVSNTSGSATSNAATLTVNVGANQPPVGTIVSPVAGMLYSAGVTIVYRGSGSDPETGVLPASAFTWRVDFHHDTHVHPFLAERSGSTFGAFVIPRTGETAANVWYRIHLTVTDAGGLTHSTFRDVFPRTVTLTIASNISGLPLQLDGQPRPTSFSEVAVVGTTHTLGAPLQQTVGGTSYTFLRWSDGRPATHTIMVPAINSTFTASYR